MDLTRNTVLITGGSSGIGLELAKQLLSRDNTVIITGRDQGRLDRAKGLLPKVHAIQSDASVVANIATLHDQVAREHPTLNVLVNNAGVMRTIDLQKPATGQPADMVGEVRSGLEGPILMVQKFLPLLMSQPLAAIVNVTSGLAFVPLPTAPVYCAVKAALHSYSLSLRVQLRKTNVRVFELAPPATDTPLLKDLKPEDRKGMSIMDAGVLVAAAIKGIEGDRYEILPGQSSKLKMMNRVAPGFILKMLSKSVDRMRATS